MCTDFSRKNEVRNAFLECIDSKKMNVYGMKNRLGKGIFPLFRE